MKHLRERQAFGFTLVELALAIGIVAFALTAIIGLLSASLNSEAQSQDDTTIAAMTTQVMADLRRQRFYGVAFTSGTGPVMAGASGLDGIFVGTSGSASILGNTPLPSYYFDHSGVLITGSDGETLTRTQALAEGAIYQCTPAISSGTVNGVVSSGTAVNLINVCIAFYWPAPAFPDVPNPPTNAPNSRTIYTSIARY